MFTQSIIANGRPASEYHSINNSTVRVRVPSKLIFTDGRAKADRQKRSPHPSRSRLKYGSQMNVPTSRIYQWVYSYPQSHQVYCSVQGTEQRDISLSPMRPCKYTYFPRFKTNDRSAAVLIYGYVLYQRRLTMISARDSGNFGMPHHLALMARLTARYFTWPFAHLCGTIHCYSRQLHLPIKRIP